MTCGDGTGLASRQSRPVSRASPESLHRESRPTLAGAPEPRLRRGLRTLGAGSTLLGESRARCGASMSPVRPGLAPGSASDAG